ncbi:MAG: hypothetical protein JWP02_2719 [Acidimicrobiales bacterium]|nr:hypothetical protein [Acidimicrobiales bacterium]
MVLLAFALWLTATAVVAVPVCIFLRRVDEPEEPIDEVELDRAMKRHPSRRAA